MRSLDGQHLRSKVWANKRIVKQVYRETSVLIRQCRHCHVFNCHFLGDPNIVVSAMVEMIILPFVQLPRPSPSRAA